MWKRGWPYVVSNKIDPRDLLEHLTDVGQSHTVEFTVFGHLEETAVRAPGHLFYSLLHRSVFVLDERIVAVFFIENLEYFNGFFVAALHHEPSR